ncbi:MAG: class I SAM-dependent methyltransferase [Pseudobacteriovorax sp.]|nr:class I SAM-dependent methyltransferase [Pseudobacteriovorax sp.]
MKQFNKHAEAYQKARGKITYPDELYEYLAGITRGKESALDIGCGNGVSTFRLQPYFDHVEGVDLGDQLIEKAKLNYKGIDFRVSRSENYLPDRTYDLVTSATSFYWMDRPKICQNLEKLLNPGGVFCAYKYDWTLVYGPLRNLVEYEMATKWSRYRDPRIVDYDDTLEILEASKVFQHCERKLISNIIELSPMDLAYFFLSTSFATRYMEEEAEDSYPEEFVNQMIAKASSDTMIKANFDIHCYIGRKE